MALSAASAYAQTEKLAAAQEAVRTALIEALDHCDPFDDAGFKYCVAQALNHLGRVEEVAKLIGASPATVHRWAAGTSTPLPLMRAAIMALLKELLLFGVPRGRDDGRALLRKASLEGQARVKQSVERHTGDDARIVQESEVDKD